VSKLRKLARGKPCMVRVPGVCDGGGETTCLAHYRLAGHCGTGIKSPDILGAWCCGPCHDHVGDRGQDLAEGVMRTIAELENQGILK
jgi:hypothetical protein